MTASTSSSHMDLERSLIDVPKQELTKKAELKTSNLQIFPSLHPLSQHYRDKLDVLPRNPIKVPTVTTLEPVKKLKANDKTEKIVQEADKKSAQTPIDEVKIEKKIIKSSQFAEFKTPKLPSRLEVAKKNQTAESLKQTEKPKTAIKIKSESQEESLVVADPVIDMLNILSNQKVESLQKMATLYKSQVVREQIKRKIFEYLKWMDTIQSQGNLLLDLGMDALDIGSTNEVSEEELVYGHLRQDISQIVEVCQRSQEKLAELLRR